MANVIRKVINYKYSVSNSWLASKHTFIVLSCGHIANWSRDGHDNTNLPTEFECHVCGDIEANHAKLKEAIDNHLISHTRAKPQFDYYMVLVYKRDNTSPTGVLLYMTVPDIPEYADLLHGSLSPLSPTER